MRFSTKEDIEAPIAHVYERVTDFRMFERSILRRGIDLRRNDDSETFGVGTAWDVNFRYRGKERSAHIEMTRLDAPAHMAAKFESGGIDGQTTLELVPLSPSRTRMMLVVDLSPRTLAARLLLQSLKLAKGNLTHRFKSKVADVAEDIETAYTGI